MYAGGAPPPSSGSPGGGGGAGVTVGSRVRYVGGGRFSGPVAWADGDRLAVGEIGVVAEVDGSGVQWPYAVHFPSCFVRLSEKDLRVVEGEDQGALTAALTDARSQLDTIHAALSRATSPARRAAAPQPPMSPAPHFAAAEQRQVLEEELQRQKQVHARQAEEETRRHEALLADKGRLETELVNEMRRCEGLQSEVAAHKALLQAAQKEVQQDRAHAAARAQHVLELENEVMRYQAEVLALQQDSADLRQQLAEQQKRHNAKLGEMERVFSEKIATLEANMKMATPPANLPPSMQLEVGMSVAIAEGQCTLIERYSGSDPNFLSRQCWWVRLPDGEERLRAPGEMLAVLGTGPPIRGGPHHQIIVGSPGKQSPPPPPTSPLPQPFLQGAQHTFPEPVETVPTTSVLSTYSAGVAK